MLESQTEAMTSSDSPRSDGSFTEANDADVFEQAQPLAGEPAGATARRIGAPASSRPDTDQPTADEVEQRQET
jgi:hypothetical protein